MIFDWTDVSQADAVVDAVVARARANPDPFEGNDEVPITGAVATGAEEKEDARCCDRNFLCIYFFKKNIYVAIFSKNEY